MAFKIALKLLPLPEANTQIFNYIILTMQINQIRKELQFTQLFNVYGQLSIAGSLRGN